MSQWTWFHVALGSPAFVRQQDSGGAAAQRREHIATDADDSDVYISTVLSRDRVSTAELQLGTIESGRYPSSIINDCQPRSNDRILIRVFRKGMVTDGGTG